jgi:hypothetical protein
MDEIHFNHWLPYFDNSSYDIVLNVYLPPASIERITLVIGNYHDEDENDAVPQNTYQQGNANYAILEKLKEYAEKDAFNDAGRIRKQSGKGELIVIHQENLDKKLDESARMAISDIIEKRGEKIPPVEESQQLIQKYQEYYRSRLEKELYGENGILPYTGQEISLLKIAMEDRKNAPQHRDYHIRDLAVIRVLANIGVPIIEAQEHLTMIHNLADFYQQQYSNPREVVYWPSPF